MTENDTKALVPKSKQEVVSKAEQTKNGLVFMPDMDILESDCKITLLANMSGVQSRDLKVDLCNGVLTLAGDVAPWGGLTKRISSSSTKWAAFTDSSAYPKPSTRIVLTLS
jgi:HSP20 family molecular chaperone IbpA